MSARADVCQLCQNRVNVLFWRPSLFHRDRIIIINSHLQSKFPHHDHSLCIVGVGASSFWVIINGIHSSLSDYCNRNLLAASHTSLVGNFASHFQMPLYFCKTILVFKLIFFFIFLRGIIMTLVSKIKPFLLHDRDDVPPKMLVKYR